MFYAKPEKVLNPQAEACHSPQRRLGVQLQRLLHS